MRRLLLGTAAMAAFIGLAGESANAASSVCDADASNIVANCGFEDTTGLTYFSQTTPGSSTYVIESVTPTNDAASIPDWTVNPSLGVTAPTEAVTVGTTGNNLGGWSGPPAGTYGPNSGKYFLANGASSSYPATVFQNLKTVAGQLYDFSFYLSGDGNPSAFSASWGATTVLDLTNVPGTPSSSAYTFHSFDVVASGTSTTISFAGWDNIGFVSLDDVSVDAVPEPASMALLGVGLFGLGLIRRKRGHLPKPAPMALPRGGPFGLGLLRRKRGQ